VPPAPSAPAAVTDVYESREAGSGEPPYGSGIAVESGDRGLRVTLPRLYARGDVVVAVVAAVVALAVGAWLDATAGGTGAARLAWFAVAGVGVFFATLAISEAIPILAPRVIEDAGDRIVLSRQVGARRVLRRTLPKSRIQSIERTWREEEPGVVEIRVGGDAHRVGKGLDPAALDWLAGALRGMAGG
jgi:hypothetical protein